MIEHIWPGAVNGLTQDFWKGLLLAAVVALIFLIGLCWLLVLRARATLDTAFSPVRNSAVGWTRAVSSSVTAVLSERELELCRSNLGELRERAGADLQLLEQIASALAEPQSATSTTSSRGINRFSHQIAPQKAPIALPPIDAASNVQGFRRTDAARQWRTLPPKMLIDQLLGFTEGLIDPGTDKPVADESSLLREIGSAIPTPLEVMAVLSVGADRSANWRSGTLAALPTALIGKAERDGVNAIVLPSLLADRAIAVTLLLGLTGDDLLTRGSVHHG